MELLNEKPERAEEMGYVEQTRQLIFADLDGSFRL